MPTRNDIKTTPHDTGGWPRPKDHQNKTDKFLSVFRVMYVIIKSQKDKGNALKKHILKDIVPRGFDARIEEIQEKHQQAIEKKDETIALFNDDLKNCEHETVALQAQRDVYKDHYKNVKTSLTILKHVM